MNFMSRINLVSGLAFIAALFACSVCARAENFDGWLGSLRAEAVQQGISSALVARALPDTLRPDDRVMRLDHQQPEGGTLSFQQYKNRIVSSFRVREGNRKYLKYNYLLRKISRSYGVPPQYILALWGIETSYGRYSGGFNTIRSLATLAYEGDRRRFFRMELLDALRIVNHGDISLGQMKGSWAGAMGQCQFMPSSYEKYAQDYDKDGKRDIWHNEGDVFASTAAYLSDNGWRAKEPWGVRVFLKKNFNNKLIGINFKKPLEFWRRQGVRVPPVFAPGELLSVVQPGGKGYKAYIVGKNYRILLNWNSSTYFATAAGLLADALKR